jgi:protein-tyrosine phosphatase
MTDLDQRRLPWEGSYNIRDLGGYAAADGCPLRRGALVRADNLGHLTPAGQEALVAYGIRTVIDVRSVEECVRWPHAFSHHATICTVNIPIGTGANPEAQALLDGATDLAGWNCLALQHCQSHIAQLVRQVSQAASGGVLIHCHAGKDRTGLIAMFLLAIAGVNDETIIADYAVSDQFLGPLYDQILAQYINQPSEHRRVARLVHARPEYMRATLEQLYRRCNGPLGYLLSAGMTAGEFDRIRSRFC